MRGRSRIGLLATLVVAALAVATAAGAASAPLVQNVETSGYPSISFTLALPPEVTLAGGDMPEVAVTENGLDVKNVNVRSLVNEPSTIDAVLAIDVSGSMAGAPIENAKAAALNFVQSMGDDDRIAVVAFSSTPTIVQGFTADRALVAAAISGLRAAGETALYDGLVTSASVASSSTAEERYIVALSDGADTMSVNSANDAARALTNAKTPMFAVALESPDYTPSTLRSIARSSHGRVTTAKGSASLTSIYGAIAEEMQARYEVQFTSMKPNTMELNLGVTVGSGDGESVTTITIPNPQYEQAPAVDIEPFEPVPANARTLIAFAAAAFLAITLFVASVALIVFRDRAALEQLDYYGQVEASREGGADTFEEGTVRGRLAAAMTQAVDRQGITGKVQIMLERGGISLRANEYVSFVVLITVSLAIIVWALTGNLFFGILAGFASAVAPFLFLKMAIARRLHKFESQLPDILDMLGSSLRSGWGIQQALDLVVEEVEQPAKGEFRRTQAESRLGMPFEEALQRMTLRVESPDLAWAVSAIAIQREVGGNLAEVLSIVSGTIRQRGELERMVRSLTAEGRLTMWVLSVLPFVVFGALLVLNPEYVKTAIESPIGIGMYVLTIILLAIGITLLQKLTKIKV